MNSSQPIGGNPGSGKSGEIRVLVVDDSAFMRKLISDMLSSAKGISVVGTARDGAEAIEKVEELKVDVVTLDVEMPRMGGLDALSRIVERFATPCVMLSAHTRSGARATMEALTLGAFDFVAKPSGTVSLDIEGIESELVSKIEAASRVNPNLLRKRRRPHRVQMGEESREARVSPAVVAIGASTGGPRALTEILSSLPADLPASVLVVQHMPRGFTDSFARRLNRDSELRVREAVDGDQVRPGEALIGPAGVHLEVASQGRRKVVRLTEAPAKLGLRPSVDVMMTSAARVYGSRTVGVVLTGMGRDGRDGVKAIKRAGGMTLAEDESTCVIFGMPKAAISSGCIDRVVPLGEIPETIVETVKKM